MTTYDFVHLVLLAAGGTIHGRTKLQKTVYFVGALSGRLEELGYRAHYYGPYSSEVAASVDELRGLGFLTQRVTSGGSYDAKGFEVARYDYELTEAGKLIAEEKTKEHPDEWRRIEAAMNNLLQAKADDYVKLSVAAKSFFLLRESKASTTPEERSRQTSQFGWVVSAEQFREADQLLQSIKLLPTQSTQ